MSSSSSTQSSGTDNDYQQRQPAKRAFAREFQDATETFQDSDDDRAPKFALLPTGARANRVFIAGALTETENKSENDEFWQGRVVDPTGTHYVYAGQYQPEAAQQLATIKPPTYVSVIGKPRSYTNDDGETYTSVKAEAVSVVDGATRDRWVIETAKQTHDRIRTFKAYRRPNKNGRINAPGGSDDPSEIPPDVTKAAEHYGDDISVYRSELREALESLIGEDD
jgi:RPA family protein